MYRRQQSSCQISVDQELYVDTRSWITSATATRERPRVLSGESVLSRPDIAQRIQDQYETTFEVGSHQRADPGRRPKSTN